MIFTEQVARKPDHYSWSSDFIDAMWSGHWTPNEFTFTSDLQNYRVDLTDDERLVVRNTLSAIGQIEIAVKKFWSRLGDNLPHPSLVDLGLVMAQIEVIHNRAYEKLLDTLQLNDAFEENLKLDIIRGRVAYLRRYLDKAYKDQRKQYVYALILFTLFVENVSLFSQFYVILWFNRFKGGILKDTAQQVDYTKREEMLHAQVGIRLVQTIRNEHPELFDAELEAKVAQEAVEAFKAESKIIDWMLGDYSGDRLTRPILKEYVRSRINDSLVAIGFAAPFEIDQTLIEQTLWMEEDVLGYSRTDFFNKRPTEYTDNDAPCTAEQLFAS